MKDKYFSLAGQQLLRIRSKQNASLDRKDFKNLINEIIKK